MSNIDYLNDMVMKAVTTISTLSTSVLQPQYFNQYIREATEPRTILNDARRVTMDSNVVNIDRIAFGSRILQVVAENTALTDYSDPTPAQNVLTAKHFAAMMGLTDQAARRTIEGRTNFESTIISMFADRAGQDWEELAVWGDTAKYTGGGDGGAIPVLHAQDGWIKRAGTGQHLYGTGAGKDFDYPNDGIVGALKACIDLYPKKYMAQPRDITFYMGWDYFDLYVDEWGDRQTAAGDQAMETGVARPYKGFQVKYAPVLDSTAGVAAYGAPILMSNPKNMVYGVFEDVSIEPDRVPKAFRTDWIIGMETDQDFENETAFVACFPDATHP